jgi:menaquinol-cytochrome c reductase iron-sulfur subunit
MDERGVVMERRSFLYKGVAMLGGLAALAVAIPGIGFFFSPFFKKKKQVWQSVGKQEEFKAGTISRVSFPDPSPLPWAGVVAETAAWLKRSEDGGFVAFSVNCTHLGCPVRWVSDAKLFLCPCHGGVYTQDGEVAGGPPPRSLFQYPVRVLDGKVEILSSELPIG